MNVPVTRLPSDKPPRVASMKRLAIWPRFWSLASDCKNVLADVLATREEKAAANQQHSKLPNGFDRRHGHGDESMAQGRGEGHSHGVEAFHREEYDQRPQHASDAESRHYASELSDVGMQNVFHDYRAEGYKRTAKEPRRENGE